MNLSDVSYGQDVVITYELANTSVLPVGTYSGWSSYADTCSLEISKTDKTTTLNGYNASVNAFKVYTSVDKVTGSYNGPGIVCVFNSLPSVNYATYFKLYSAPVVETYSKFNQTNDIINGINSSMNEVNDNINDMKENVDNTLNSEDEDTSSSKCGVVCKLKGIWDGIIHLPQNIWNLMKGGFEAITNALGSLFDAIKGIFIPKPECHMSSNLLPFEIGTITTKNGITLEVQENGLHLIGTPTITSGYISFNFPIEIKSGTYTLQFPENKEGLGFQFPDSVSYVNYSMASTDTIPHTLKLTSDLNGTGSINVRYDVGTIDLLITPMFSFSSSELNYEPYGQEICTEQSFFGWFERFGEIIKGFFENLLSGIIDGVKSLFIPDSEEFQELLNNFKDAMTEKLGAIGEVLSLFTDFFSNIAFGEVKKTISLPSLKVMDYTIMESQEVEIFPSQLSTFQTIVMTMSDIVITLAFINMLKKKYEGFIGGNTNDY